MFSQGDFDEYKSEIGDAIEIYTAINDSAPLYFDKNKRVRLELFRNLSEVIDRFVERMQQNLTKSLLKCIKQDFRYCFKYLNCNLAR